MNNHATILVADDDEDSAEAVGENLDEIAADLLRGSVDRVDMKAGKGLIFLRHDELLDLAGGLHFTFESGIFHAGAEMTAALTDEDHDKAGVTTKATSSDAR